MNDYIFGVFNRGKLVMFIGRITCTPFQAGVIVGILDLAKDVLKPGHYYACDFYNRKEAWK